MNDKIKQYATMIEDDIFLNIRKLSRGITKFYDRKFSAAGIDINSTQFMVLLKISCVEGKPLIELSKCLSVDRTTLTRNLIPLEKEGFIKFEKLSDGRKKSVFLTEKGITNIEKGMIVFEDISKQIYKKMYEEEYPYSYAEHIIDFKLNNNEPLVKNLKLVEKIIKYLTES